MSLSTATTRSTLPLTSTSSTTGSLSSSSGSSSSSTTGSSTGTQSLVNPNTFLQLLIAQMTNQSPLSPTDSNTMMQQLAMMQMVEEVSTLNTTMQNWASQQSLSSASSLVGRTVVINSGQSTVTGTVSSVSSSGGNVNVEVNGNNYQLTAVQSIQ